MPTVRNPVRTPAHVRGPHHTSSIDGKYVATAYGPPWNSLEGSGVTARGTRLAPRPVLKMTGPYVVAVDPAVVPLGTKLYIWPNPFDYKGPFTADDTGGAIKGRRIDFYDPRGRLSQNTWGRRIVRVSIDPSTLHMPAAPWEAGGGDANPDLGPGGPINFGGLDTGKSPLDFAKELAGKLLSYDMSVRVLKVVGGGLFILFGAATIGIKAVNGVNANPVVKEVKKATSNQGNNP